MKKICYSLCFLFAFMFVSNVYAADDQWIAALARGESVLLDRYDSLTCTSTADYIAFEVDGKCLITNNLSMSKTSDVNVLAYTDEATSTKYYVGLNADEIAHVAGRIIPYELTYLINNKDSVARKVILENTLNETKKEWILNAGYEGNKIYIQSGLSSNPIVVTFDYNSTNRVMSYAFTTDVELTYEESVAIVLSYYLPLFVVESDPTFETEAKAVMEAEDCLDFVYFDDIFDDDLSELSNVQENGRTEFAFAMLLTDNTAANFVKSYNYNKEHGEEVNPINPIEPKPAEPTPDPTQPTQPTQPAPQPNTGDYLPLVGILWLLMFGMVFISCRKTMFKKI